MEQSGERQGLLLLDGELVAGSLQFAGGRITGIERGGSHAGVVIAPGLIDLHVHGFGGGDPYGDLERMARELARVGTTTFQPTLFPDAPLRLGQELERLRSVVAALPKSGAARVVGFHLEGPFVNPLAAGALPIEDLATPSVEALRQILGPATGDGRMVRTVTLAPELPGALELARELATAGIRCSLGHSRADHSQARAGLGSGATGVTHLFNAMSGFHHRDAGLAGLALIDGGLFAELIGDLVHVSVQGVQLALAARGPQGLCLVSDALSGAGTGCDVFHACGREHVQQGGAFYYPSDVEHPEPRLAGSACHQLEMVRRLVTTGQVHLADALTMASATPARALGLEDECGSLQVGLRADLVLLDPETHQAKEVLVGGVPV